MAFSRRLGVVCIWGACWFLAVGCNDDEDQKDPSSDGGEGGEAPSAGKSSVAGSTNNAGKGGVGTAGKGGGGGSSGTATAGASGEAPVAGGAGGAQPGNGGAAGSPDVPGGGAGGDGGAEAGGAGGAGGDPGVAVAKSCSNECEIDSDCAIGIDERLKCNQANKRCENPDALCDADSDCLAVVSDWVTPCVDDDGCFAGFEACVTSNGKGYCAALADTSFPDFPCLLGSLLTAPRFGAQGDVEVCGSLDARCFGGTCQAGCGDVDKGGCAAGEGNTCSEQTGLCECGTGAECASQVCENSHCVECATSEQCAATAQFTGLDICVNGKCGCSAAAVCLDTTAEGTPVCE